VYYDATATAVNITGTLAFHSTRAVVNVWHAIGLGSLLFLIACCLAFTLLKQPPVRSGSQALRYLPTTIRTHAAAAEDALRDFLESASDLNEKEFKERLDSSWFRMDPRSGKISIAYQQPIQLDQGQTQRRALHTLPCFGKRNRFFPNHSASVPAAGPSTPSESQADRLQTGQVPPVLHDIVVNVVDAGEKGDAHFPHPSCVHGEGDSGGGVKDMANLLALHPSEDNNVFEHTNKSEISDKRLVIVGGLDVSATDHPVGDKHLPHLSG
jgi:hypothetical protein